MSKYIFKYRLIIVAILFVAVLVLRNIKPWLKKTNDEDTHQTTGQKSPELIRNINHLIFTSHAKCRMECRDITEEEIREILHAGKFNYNKSDLNAERGATYALEGYSKEYQHLRIIFAPKQNELVVVTCIDLDKEWQCDCN